MTEGTSVSLHCKRSLQSLHFISYCIVFLAWHQRKQTAVSPATPNGERYNTTRFLTDLTVMNSKDFLAKQVTESSCTRLWYLAPQILRLRREEKIKMCQTHPLCYKWGWILHSVVFIQPEERLWFYGPKVVVCLFLIFAPVGKLIYNN